MRTTALGSLPGTDLGAGVRLGLGSTSLPWVPEFPARGPWAGMVGRALGLVEGLAAELLAGEWRLTSVPGRDQRRARAALRDDLDVLEENAHGLTGPLKVSVCGPWTLAAAVVRPLGGRVLGDRGARRDLAQSLSAGVTAWVEEIERRLPRATVVLQVDEPSLPAVLGGDVPTEGGYFRHRPVDRAEAVETLRWLGGHALHCCASGLDVDLALGPDGAGFGAVSLDQDLITRAQWDVLGSALDAGRDLWLGCASTARGGQAPSADALTRRVLSALRPLDLGPVLAERVVLTPACGLAGWAPGEVSALLRALATTAERVTDELSR